MQWWWIKYRLAPTWNSVASVYRNLLFKVLYSNNTNWTTITWTTNKSGTFHGYHMLHPAHLVTHLVPPSPPFKNPPLVIISVQHHWLHLYLPIQQKENWESISFKMLQHKCSKTSKGWTSRKVIGGGKIFSLHKFLSTCLHVLEFFADI
jgi:hypothetical protein